MAKCSDTTSSPNCQAFMSADQASRSHCDRLVWFEIFSIQNAILDGVRDCEQCVTISNSSPITSYSSIESVNIINGGTGYFPVTAEANIVHPDGQGAEFNVTTSNTGEIVSINVTAGGTDYDPVTAQADGSVSGNGDATFDVIVGANGELTVVPVVTPGTGYSVGDPILITHPNGINATVEVASVGSNGEVISTVITNNGSGYEPVNATIEIIHPNGFGFEGIVNVSSGLITSISILNGGTAYNKLYPTLEIDGSGQSASFGLNIDSSTGEIIDITVLNGGFGYSEDDTIDVIPAPTSGGQDADLELVISEVTGVCNADWPSADPILFYKVYTNQRTDEKINKQIEFIKQYFECLGYDFRILPNPDTSRTLVWKICW